MTKAIVPVEEEPKVIDAPKPFGFIELGKDTKYEELPITPAPFYVLAQEGIFRRMKSTLGISTLRVDELPKSLGKMGHKGGYFDWNAPPVPKEVCAQVVDFFRRIWDKHRAEAEVLLTARIEKDDKGFPVIKEWRVFIPTQKVSMGGVESVYEPTHIAKGFQVVGTMHSHCNFSAFHSSTDTNDASSFDGLHITIGFVDRKQPQTTAMVSVSGYMVDMDKNKETVADFSDLECATAPSWWDNYVFPTKDLVGKNHHIKGVELFDRYPKRYTPPATGGGYGFSDGWGGYRNPQQQQQGSKVYCQHANTCECETATHKICCQAYSIDDCRHVKSCKCSAPTHTKCCANIDAAKTDTKPLGELVKEEDALLPDDTKKNKSQEEEAFGNLLDLPTNAKDKVFDDLLTDGDLARLMELPEEKGAVALRVMLFQKMAAAKDVLQEMGVDISFVVNKSGTQKVMKKKKEKKSGKRQN